MLVDHVTITIKAGDGGNGAVHFRRNAQTARGGPDGGNGGNGGNVYAQGIDDILGLQEFRFRKKLAAEDGIKGGRQNLFGRQGKDLVVRIPLGTQVTNTTTKEVFEISDTTTRLLVAKGGVGGRGNNEFKTATDQAPHYAEKGTAGEEKELQLDLRLIADVGLIGLPNAGKSSLLKALTNATPKIGNYAFTTLEPNIGMLVPRSLGEVGMAPLAIADIPGLIEGASVGRGLGIQFLRHIEKTKLLVHCIDITQEHILDAYTTIRKELGEYSPAILEKPEIILLTKADMCSEKDIQKIVVQTKKLVQKEVYAISIFDAARLTKLQQLLKERLEK